MAADTAGGRRLSVAPSRDTMPAAAPGEAAEGAESAISTGTK